MQTDKKPSKWGRFLVFIWLGCNLVPCYVTWAQYGFYAALGWLVAIMMIIGLVGADIVIGGQQKIIQKLDELCRRLIKERDAYDKQHKAQTLQVPQA